MHSKSDYIKIIINDEADEVIKEIFEALSSCYQIGLETSMKGSEFDFVFSYYIINVIKLIRIVLDQKKALLII